MRSTLNPAARNTLVASLATYAFQAISPAVPVLLQSFADSNAQSGRPSCPAPISTSASYRVAAGSAPAPAVTPTINPSAARIVRNRSLIPRGFAATRDRPARFEAFRVLTDELVLR